VPPPLPLGLSLPVGAKALCVSRPLRLQVTERGQEKGNCNSTGTESARDKLSEIAPVQGTGKDRGGLESERETETEEVREAETETADLGKGEDHDQGQGHKEPKAAVQETLESVCFPAQAPHPTQLQANRPVGVVRVPLDHAIGSKAPLPSVPDRVFIWV